MRRWKLQWVPAALRALASLPPAPRFEVLDAINDLADNPEPAGSVAMTGKGQGFRRLKVGAYRVVYRIQLSRRSVLIVRIDHRGQVYRGLEPK